MYLKSFIPGLITHLSIEQAVSPGPASQAQFHVFSATESPGQGGVCIIPDLQVAGILLLHSLSLPLFLHEPRAEALRMRC